MNGKYIVMFLMICLLSVSLVASAEWDNCKEYDEIKKEIKLKDGCPLGIDIPFVTNEIATIKLDTPLNYEVAVGEDVKVWQISIQGKKAYQDAFKLFEIYNKGLAKEEGGDWKDYEETKFFTLKKFIGYENFTKPIYSNDCVTEWNEGNQTNDTICTKVFEYNQTWQEEIWELYDSKDIEKDVNITLAIFTEVNIGDHYEVIPTIAGKKIEEWSSWEASLFVGLVFYHNMDNINVTGTGSIDMTGQFNGTITGTTNTSGIIGSGRDFGGQLSDTDNIELGDLNTHFGNDGTYCGWYKADNNITASGDGFGYISTVADGELYHYGASELSYMSTMRDDRISFGNTGTDFRDWTYLCFLQNTSSYLIYENNVQIYSTGGETTVNLDDHSFIGCSTYNGICDFGSGGYPFLGIIDEVSMWNRTLTFAEITTLYNGGSGITYPISSTPSSDLAINLTNPTANLTEQGTIQFKTYNFTCNSSATEGVRNLSLYINNSLITTVTNTSVNQQEMFLSGNHSVTNTGVLTNWTCQSGTNLSIITDPVRTLNYTYVNIEVILKAPEDNFVTNLTSFNFTANITSRFTGIVNTSIYFNGVLNQTNSSGTEGNTTFQIDHIPYGVSSWYFDAWCTDGVHYFSGTNRTYIISDINVTQINPENAYNSSNTTVNFNCTGETSLVGMINLTLMIDGVDNFTVTNSTPAQNLSVDVLRTLNEGTHNWSCEGWNTNSYISSPVRTMNLDETKPVITLTSPETSQGLLNDGDQLQLNWTVTDVNPYKCSYGYEEMEQIKALDGTSYNGSTNLTFWIYVNDNTTESLHYYVETQASAPSPRIHIYQDVGSKTGLFQDIPVFGSGGLEIVWFQLNVTGNGWHYVTVEQRCLTGTCFDYKILRLDNTATHVATSFMTNDTEIACNLNTTNFNYLSGQDDLIFYANDTLGNDNYTTRSWSVQASVLDEAFITPVVEGSNNLFYITFDVTGPVTITDIDLIYNGTVNEATFDTIGNQYNASLEFIAPNVEADTNLTFFWQITYNDSTQVNSTAHNQTVTLLGVDDCSVNNFVLFNFSLLDEETQQFINGTYSNTTVEIELSLFAEDTNNLVLHFFQNYTEDNNPQICLADGLGTATFDAVLLVQYRGDDYATEEYNIIGGEITNDSITTNISLYDLLLTDSTEFLIIYKDESFTAIQDALIQIQRKYVSEGVFKTVEIPKTDQFGQTKGHLDVDKGIYTFVVVKDGVIIALFNDTTVSCQNPLIDECVLNLNELLSQAEFSDWDNFGGVSILQTFDEGTRTVTTQFSSTSGAVVTMNITTTKFDRFENTTVCTDSLLSASGTLSCVVPESFGNITIISRTRVGGELLQTQSYSITPDITEYFGVSSYVFLLILLLTIPFMLAGSTIGVVFGAIVGFMMAGMLSLYDGGSTFGTTSSIIWLIISGGIIIWKIAQRE